MIRQPLGRKAPRGRAVSSHAMMPAPVRGWRSDESKVNTTDGSALIMTNWVPEADAVRIRKGHTSYATGMTDEVETLMAWRGPASSKLFAANNEAVYEITGGGAVGAAEFSSLTNNYWSWTNFLTSAPANMLVMCNGDDAVRNYDGTTWTTPTITGTGLTSSDLNYVWQHKTRLWFVEKDTQSAWYLGVDTISGTITEFPLGALFKRGGHLIAGETWSMDAGDGMDDMNVFLSSEGDCLVYSMSDPADATTLTLRGVYYVGKPIGKRPFFRLGGELLIMTYQGIIPISAAINTSEVLLEEASITAPIRRDWGNIAETYGGVTGWMIEDHPQSNILIVNVPLTANSIYEQFIVNTLTGAWAKWDSINSVCWLEHEGAIYFGGTSGVVFQAETGSTDNGDSITATVLPAFTSLGAHGRIKHVKMIRPIIASNMNVTASVSVAIDFQDAPDVGQTAQSVQSGAFTWDSSVWDGTDLWLGTTINVKWRTGSNIGIWVSPYMEVTVTSTSSSEELSYRLYGYDIDYEVGGVL